MKYTITIEDTFIDRKICLIIAQQMIPNKYSSEIFDCFVAQRFLQEHGISMCLPDDFYVNQCIPIHGAQEVSIMITSKEFEATIDYVEIPKYYLEGETKGNEIVYRKVKVGK